MFHPKCSRGIIAPLVVVTLLMTTLTVDVECASLPQINSTTTTNTNNSIPSAVPPTEMANLNSPANSTEGRNSILLRKPWAPNLLGQNSLSSILDPLNPLATFSRLPQLTGQNSLGSLAPLGSLGSLAPLGSLGPLSSAPIYSPQFDLSTEYSSTANSGLKSFTSPPSASSTIDPNEPAPGAMSLLYVFSEASKRIPIAELPKRVESMGDSLNNWAGDAMKGIEAQAVSFGDTFVEYLQSAAGEAVKRTGQLLSTSLDSLERTVKSYLSDWIGCGPPKG